MQHNSWAILFLGLFVGVATNLGLIGAQSYLLSRTDAIYTLYCSIVAGLLFSAFLKKNIFARMKFAKFSALCFVFFIALLIILRMNALPEFYKAILWYGLAVFGFDLLRWIVSELTQRHLDPARAASYFSYSSAFFEGGTILVIFYLKANNIVLTPNQTIGVVIGCCALGLAVLTLYFLPQKNLEIKFSEARETDEKNKSPHLNPLVSFFVLATFLFTIIEVGEEYLVKIVVKDALQNYDSIRAMTETYFSLSSAFIIVLSYVTGRVTQSRRISPVTLLVLEATLMLVLAFLCWLSGSLYVFIIFEILRRVSEYCLYRPGHQMLLSSLVSSLRRRLRSKENYYNYVLAPLLMAGFFYFIDSLLPHDKTKAILVLIFVSALFLLPILFRLRRLYVKFLYELILSGKKAAAIMAAHLLSYLKPQDFVKRMTEVLETSPKKLLRKTIIIGLGFTKNEDSIDVIKREFFSDREEIQIAVLDALQISKQFRAIQFMINIVLDKLKPKTQRVRLNAMSVIGALYGKRAIPFLLNGLDHSDPRVMANTLEVLGQFREKGLIPYFKKYLTSDIPRLRANAILGMARFPGMKIPLRTVLRDSLRDPNLGMKASALYVVGKLREKRLRDDVVALEQDEVCAQNPKITNALAWALISLKNRRGYDRACEIWVKATSTEEMRTFMHFFSLYKIETRYDMIRFLLNQYHNDSEAIKIANERLKKSVYDFHEELEYLKLYSHSLLG